MRNRTEAMDPSARDGAPQSLSPRRRPRLAGGVPATATAPAAPAPRPGHDHDMAMAPGPSPVMLPTKPRARLPLRQRRPATPVPILPPQIEPLTCRPVPRPRGTSERGVRSSPAPIAISVAEFPFEVPELSSSVSSTASCASSASSRMMGEEEETCESSLSEPDLGFEEKGGSLVSVPAGARVKEFVGEGSANVVVGIELPEGTPLSTRRFFEGMSLDPMTPPLGTQARGIGKSKGLLGCNAHDADRGSLQASSSASKRSRTTPRSSHTLTPSSTATGGSA